MQIHVRSGTPADQDLDALILAVGADGALPAETAAVDQRLDGALRTALDAAGFSGKVGKTLVLPTLDRLPARRLVLTGIGSSPTAFDLTRAWGLAARAARDAGAREVASAPPPGDHLDVATRYRSAVEGIVLGLYRFLEYRTTNLPTTEVESITFIDGAGDAGRGIEAGQRIAAGVVLARNLGNQPPNDLFPAQLAQFAQETAADKGLGCQAFDRRGLEQLGAGAILGVGQGSSHEPRLIHLTSTPSGESRGSIALVGKAITFDTGGVDLKTAEGMSTMKIDMAGGAAVLGAMSVVASLGLPLTVHGVIAAAENMASGTSFRPGDVLRSMDGKTIEITNTDAEGRLVLADALTYAIRQGAGALVDLATLTGSAVVALGRQASAVFGTDQRLVDDVLAAAEQTGEPMWRLPLWDDFREQVKGDFADLKNSGARAGGAIYGATFLREFVGDVPWAHLDIAGPAWAEQKTDLSIKGATGYGVRTLLTLLERRAAS